MAIRVEWRPVEQRFLWYGQILYAIVDGTAVAGIFRYAVGDGGRQQETFCACYSGRISIQERTSLADAQNDVCSVLESCAGSGGNPSSESDVLLASAGAT